MLRWPKLQTLPPNLCRFVRLAKGQRLAGETLEALPNNHRPRWLDKIPPPRMGNLAPANRLFFGPPAALSLKATLLRRQRRFCQTINHAPLRRNRTSH